MKKRNLINLLLFLLIFSFTGNSYASSNDIFRNENHQKNPGKQKIQLFNGKDLDGWYTYIKERGRNNDPLKVFTVQNRMIRISGEEFGCITTNDEYENYKLTVKFRWGDQTFAPRTDKARDSGILLHSVGEDGASSGTWMYSIECQIIEGGTGDFIVVGDGSNKFSITCPVAEKKQGNSYVYQSSGKKVTINSGRINWFSRDPEWKDIKDFRSKNDIEKSLGKWNLIECVVNGNEIHIYLNGVLVNQAFDVKPQKGKIQIQSEGAEIFFKKIILSPL